MSDFKHRKTKPSKQNKAASLQQGTTVSKANDRPKGKKQQKSEPNKNFEFNRIKEDFEDLYKDEAFEIVNGNLDDKSQNDESDSDDGDNSGAAGGGSNYIGDVAHDSSSDDTETDTSGSSSGSGGAGLRNPSGSLASARSNRAAINNAVKSERTSALAEALREDFLQDVRAGIKAKGHKVDALDNKHTPSTRKAAAAKIAAENAGAGGPEVELHPLMPKPEGIADNFVLPDSENPDSEMRADPELANKYRNRLSHSQRMTLRERLKQKQRQRLAAQNRHRPGAPPPKFTPY